VISASEGGRDGEEVIYKCAPQTQTQSSVKNGCIFTTLSVVLL